jgi:hypothetical protein
MGIISPLMMVNITLLVMMSKASPVETNNVAFFPGAIDP